MSLRENSCTPVRTHSWCKQGYLAADTTYPATAALHQQHKHWTQSSPSCLHHSWNPSLLVSPPPLGWHISLALLITWIMANSLQSLGGQRSSGSFGQAGWPVRPGEAAQHHHYTAPFLSNIKGTTRDRAALKMGCRSCTFPSLLFANPCYRDRIFNISTTSSSLFLKHSELDQKCICLLWSVSDR